MVKITTERGWPFMQNFIRSPLKYDCIYINEFDTPRELKIALNQYIHEYNTYRPHSSIGGQCPSQVYDGIHSHKVA